MKSTESEQLELFSKKELSKMEIDYAKSGSYRFTDKERELMNDTFYKKTDKKQINLFLIYFKYLFILMISLTVISLVSDFIGIEFSLKDVINFIYNVSLYTGIAIGVFYVSTKGAKTIVIKGHNFLSMYGGLSYKNLVDLLVHYDIFTKKTIPLLIVNALTTYLLHLLLITVLS